MSALLGGRCLRGFLCTALLCNVLMMMVAMGAHGALSGTTAVTTATAQVGSFPNYVVDDGEAGSNRPYSVIKTARRLAAGTDNSSGAIPAAVSCQLEFVFAWGPYPKLRFEFDAALTTTKEIGANKAPLYKVVSLSGALIKTYSENVSKALGLDLLPTTDPNFPYLGADDRVMTWTDQYGVQPVLTENGVAVRTSESAFYILAYNTTRRYYIFKTDDTDPGVGFRPAPTMQCQWRYAPPVPPPRPCTHVFIRAVFTITSNIGGKLVNVTMTMELLVCVRPRTCTGTACGEYPFEVSSLTGTFKTEYPGYRYVETVRQLLDPAVAARSGYSSDNLARDPKNATVKTKGLFSSKGVTYVTNSGSDYAYSNTNNKHVVGSSNSIANGASRVIEQNNYIITDDFRNFTSSICFDSSKFQAAGDPGPVDVFFVSDVTVSMGPAIASVRAASDSIYSALQRSGMSIQYGVGEYRDYNGANGELMIVLGKIYGWDAPTLKAAFDSWTTDIGRGAGFGGQIYALYRIADTVNNPVMWRTDSTKYVILFGDAKPPAKPVQGVTIATAIKKLQARGIHVFAINAANSASSGGGLEADKTQRTSAITNATGGTTTPMVYQDVGNQLIKSLPSIVRKYLQVQPIALSCNMPSSALFFANYGPMTIPVGSTSKVCFTPILRYDMLTCAPGSKISVQCKMTVTDLSGKDLLQTAATVTFNINC